MAIRIRTNEVHIVVGTIDIETIVGLDETLLILVFRRVTYDVNIVVFKNSAIINVKPNVENKVHDVLHIVNKV